MGISAPLGSRITRSVDATTGKIPVVAANISADIERATGIYDPFVTNKRPLANNLAVWPASVTTLLPAAQKYFPDDLASVLWLRPLLGRATIIS